jgi:hypothetical protein
MDTAVDALIADKPHVLMTKEMADAGQNGWKHGL